LHAQPLPIEGQGIGEKEIVSMKHITKEIEDTLAANGRKQDAVRGTKDEIDFKPVVKLFTPDANCTWLLTETDSEYPDCAFGLCDLGLGFPELGSVSLNEISSIRGRLGLPIERDQHFEPSHPLSVYAEAARHARTITEDEKALAQAAAALERRHSKQP
jgi:hypothetical protein